MKFIVNTILDPQARVVDIVAGDFRQAFRLGVEKARTVYSAPISGLADVVIASAYPSDINLWQAGKALYSADLAVRDGGVIVLASPCYEGVGEHRDFVELLRYDYKTLDRMIANHEVHDRVGAAASLAVALVFARAQLWLVSENITDSDVALMGARKFSSLQMAVDAALVQYGDDARITFLHEATEILPELVEQVDGDGGEVGKDGEHSA